MRVVVVNVGSSTVKLAVVDGGRRVASAVVDVGSDTAVSDAVGDALLSSGRPDVVGHRIVHGGSSFTKATLLHDDVISSLAELTPLAPLHQQRSLDGITMIRRLFPDTPQVGCFDTAFFAGLPVHSRTYPLPKEWRERFGLVRFGFHGLSHSYAARRAVSLLGADTATRIVTCHLGSGASLAAIRDGRPIDTTMGFTPLEGIVMSTRSGSVDPGMLLWLQSQAALDVAEVTDGLEHRSGLLGLAGTTDMQEILKRASAGDEDATTARDVYIHRLCAGIASMAAAIDGVDALVFTGGVGENASEIRARACANLAHLGARIDESLNESAAGDELIQSADSSVAVLVVAAREEIEIANQVERLLSAAGFNG
jgi:acetate kinase